MKSIRVICAVGALVGMSIVTACAVDGSDAAEETGPATCHDLSTLPKNATQLDVSLKEWKVIPSRTTVPAGAVNIVAHNNGTMTHELLVLRGDSESALPHNADGSINEDAISRTDTIGEISEFDAGKTCGRAYDLPAGKYILVCNIVMGTEVHAAKGMVSELTVTA